MNLILEKIKNYINSYQLISKNTIKHHIILPTNELKNKFEEWEKESEIYVKKQDCYNIFIDLLKTILKKYNIEKKENNEWVYIPFCGKKELFNTTYCIKICGKIKECDDNFELAKKLNNLEKEKI